VKLKLKRLPKKIYVKNRNFDVLKNKDRSSEFAMEIEERLASEKREAMEVNQKAQILNKIVENVV